MSKKKYKEKYGVYVCGADGMGPWDPFIYGPYDSASEAQAVADAFEEQSEEDNKDLPEGDWHITTIVAELKEAVSIEDIKSGKA